MCDQCNQFAKTLGEEAFPQEMSRSEFNELVAGNTSMKAGFAVKTFALTPYPKYSAMTLQVSFSVSLVANITRPDGSVSLTQVVYYHDESGEEVFAWFCYDRFMRGDLDAIDADERITALTQLIIPSKRKEGISALKGAIAQTRLDTLKNCGYWTEANRDKSVVYTCEDTRALLYYASQHYAGKALETVLRDYYNTFITVSAASSQGKDKTKGVTFKDYAFSQPILFAGESGSGKTREAYIFAKETNASLVKLSCEAGTTSVEILGYYMKAPDGNMLWVDGAMTEAFRKASKGTSTVLLIDEMLRPDIREISIFLTALDPDPFTGEYVLRTGRIITSDDGVAVLETLRVSPEHLCVIATTNIGGKYNVGEMDKALSDRFVMFRIDTTAEGVLQATLSTCKKHSLPESIAQSCVTFWKAMKAAKAQHLVTETPTKRILIRALAHSASAAMVPLHLKVMAAHWVAIDGEGFPNSSQLVNVNKLIEESFK